MHIQMEGVDTYVVKVMCAVFSYEHWVADWEFFKQEFEGLGLKLIAKVHNLHTN